MSLIIKGFIEIKAKGKHERWKYFTDIDIESQDSPFWCYLFGVNCGKYDDKPIDHKGIFDDNRLSGYDALNVGFSDYSFHLIGMYHEDEFNNSFGPYYIHVDDIDKIDYSQVSRISDEYQEYFDLMKDIAKKQDREVRMVVWFD